MPLDADFARHAAGAVITLLPVADYAATLC